MGDDDSEDSDSEEDSSPEATRQRILTFLEAQRLAGERWTAKGISEKLDIPIAIAQIAVINPIGRNVKVEIPDVSELYGGTLIAGDGDVLPFDGIKAIGKGLFAVVVFGVRVAVLSYGKAVDLWQYILSSQRGRQGDAGDTGIRREAQDLIARKEAQNMKEALDKLMKEATQANNGQGDTQRKQRIKKEQKEQEARKSRETKDKKKKK
jgi:hypothetical protein